MPRPLLPQTSAASNPDLTAPAEPASVRRRPNGIQAVACLACQKRKTKCNGARPQCRTCASKRSPCVYDALEGQTRFAALKSRNAVLQAKLASSVNLLWSLKSMPPREADALLERIRTSSDPASVLESFSADQSAPPAQQSSSPEHEQSSSSSVPADAAAQPIHPLGPLLYRGFAASNPQAFSVLKSPVCREAFAFFIKCTGVLFHIFTLEQGSSAMDEVLQHGDAAVSRAALCEVCAMVAIGSQYSHGRISATTGDTFYALAKQFLDDVVESDPLRAIKVCALLALYNIIIKATVSLAFIEMGLGLGSSQGLNYTLRRPNIPADKWIDCKRVWRTLLCLKGWLIATLGYASWDGWMSDLLASRDISSEGELPTEDLIQMEMARLAIIKAKIFQTTFVFSDLTLDSVNSIREDLRTWYAELPQSMQLANLADSAMDDGPRRGIYLVHCLHLGAMILLQRRIFQQYLPTESTDPELAESTIRDLSDLIQEGFTAAVQSARILDLVMSQDGIFQRCWLCIFQSYISSVDVMFMAAQKLLHGYPRQECAAYLSTASRSLRVLEFCATTDHLAQSFFTSIRGYQEYLVNIAHDDQSIEQVYQYIHPCENPMIASTPHWEHLLKLPPGDSPLHTVSRDLLRLLCTPFAGIQKTESGDSRGALPPRMMINAEEVALGVHMDWSQDAEMSGYGMLGRNVNVREEVMSSLTSGYFIESEEPCGWTVAGVSSNGPDACMAGWRPQ